MLSQQHLLPSDILAKLDLHKQPFTKPELKESIYTHPGNEIIINSIRNQISKCTFTTIVKGEQGIGKSCVITQLNHAETASDLKLLTIQSEPRTLTSQLLMQINPAYHAGSSSEPHEIAYSTARHLFNTFRSYANIGILIDDAHTLSHSTLRALIQFFQAINKEQHGNISLVLFGENSIAPKLSTIDTATLAEDAIYSMQLMPLNKQVTRDYLEFRLQQAGAKQTLLNNNQVQQIYKQSGGIPANINRLACEYLLETQNKSRFGKIFSR